MQEFDFPADSLTVLTLAKAAAASRASSYAFQNNINLAKSTYVV